MIKAVYLTVILMVSNGSPQMQTIRMPSLDECVRTGIEFMVTESKDLNNSRLPYKQGFTCEEHVIPTN